MNRLKVLLGAAAALSVYWSILLANGYQRTEHDRALPGPDWMQDLLWKVDVGGFNTSSSGHVQLPVDFQDQSRAGDRLEHRYHSIDFLGLNWRSTEVFLWREDRAVAAWREHALPQFLLVLIAAIAPLIVAGGVTGSCLWIQPRLRSWKEWSTLSRLLAGAIGVILLILSYSVAFYAQPDAVLVSRAAQGLKGAPHVDGHPDGAWTGDVTELYRMGAIRRAVAEADSAPIRPLVPRPRPYHGYFFIAMETGPSMTADSDEPIPLKKTPRNRETFAFCAYPAKSGPNQQVWLVCPTGFFGRRMEGGRPVLHWPTTKQMQKEGWGRYCRGNLQPDGPRTAVADARGPHFAVTIFPSFLNLH